MPFSTFFSTFLTWSSRNIHSLPATIHSMPATPLLWTSEGKFWQPLFSFTSECFRSLFLLLPLFLFTTGLKLGDFIFSFLDRFFDHRWRHYYFLRILCPSSLKLNLMQVSCMGAHSQVPSQLKKRKLGNFCSLHPPQRGIEPGTSRSTSSAFTNVATSTDIGPRVFGWFIYEIWMCFWQG